MALRALAASAAGRINPGHQSWQSARMVVKAHSHDVALLRVLLMDWES